MGLYWIKCYHCGVYFQWWSGNTDQACSDCKKGNQNVIRQTKQKPEEKEANEET